MHFTIHVFLEIVLVLNSVNGYTFESNLFEELFQNYSSAIAPKATRALGQRQVLVNVTVYVASMYSISDANMEYSMTMLLRQRWVDPRLRYSAPPDFKRLELAVSSLRNVDIWVPDLYIINEKKSEFHDVTVPNELLHIYPDGAVQSSVRVTGTYSCDMRLSKYPLDTQVCRLDLESYGQSVDNVKFQWAGSGVTIQENMTLPQFRLEKVEDYNCEKDYYGILYTCIGAQFTLKRDIGYYIIQIYIPSALIVIISWVSFWVDCEAVPARITLGLLTVLTMTTQSLGARANLPYVSYIKAIDVWMVMSLTFVFSALLEFAYVNVLTRVSNRQKSGPTPSLGGHDKWAQEQGSSRSDNVKNHLVKYRISLPCFKALQNSDERARVVDKIARVAFPFAFVVFNVGYWVFYLLIL